MKKSKSADVLADPEIQRHTERILALREEERQTRENLGRLIAAIGAELLAVKEALDRLSDKTAWLRWLKEHVHYSAKTAQNYMSVARFAKKTKALSFFLAGMTFRGATREEYAADILRAMDLPADRAPDIRGRKGRLATAVGRSDKCRKEGMIRLISERKAERHEREKLKEELGH